MNTNPTSRFYKFALQTCEEYVWIIHNNIKQKEQFAKRLLCYRLSKDKRNTTSTKYCKLLNHAREKERKRKLYLCPFVYLVQHQMIRTCFKRYIQGIFPGGGDWGGPPPSWRKFGQSPSIRHSSPFSDQSLSQSIGHFSSKILKNLVHFCIDFDYFLSLKLP